MDGCDHHPYGPSGHSEVARLIVLPVTPERLPMSIGGNANSTLECLGHGDGMWRPDSGRETYMLPVNTFVPDFNRSSHWWGACDDATRRTGSERPRRPELKWSWVPQGAGCSAVAALLRDRDAIRRSWCARFAACTVLFVGDSTQGQLFLSFAQLLGASHTVSHQVQCYSSKAHTNARQGRELDVSTQLCGQGKSGVTARFVRNELLRIGTDTSDTPGAKNGSRWLCDFTEAARGVDLIVLNRGQHFVPDPEFERTLGHTLVELRRLAPAAVVVYRSTWTNFLRCEKLADPLTTPYDLPSRSPDPFVEEWRRIKEQNKLARQVIQHTGALWLNILPSSAFRPGGHHRPGAHCSHYCLPGPIDDWSMLLMVLTLNMPPADHHLR